MSSLKLKNLSDLFQVAWYNKSLSSRDCPEKEIRKIKNFLLLNDVTVRQRVIQAFEPQFHLADIKVRHDKVLRYLAFIMNQCHG